MNQTILPRADTVFRRTLKGQAAAMPSNLAPLREDEQRLLLLVNGFTPLSKLSRFCDSGDAVDTVASILKGSGLIEEAGPARSEAVMQFPWREVDS